MLVNAAVERAETTWPTLAEVLYIPRNDAEYEHLVDILNRMLDVARSDEAHPLISLIQIIGIIIEKYEVEHFPELESHFPL